MKFISIGNKRSEYEYLDDIRNDTDTGKPYHMPSYYDTAKKSSSSKQKPLHR